MPVTQQQITRAVARAYGATRVILFGSALDAPEKARDLDLACDLPGLDVFACAGRLEEELDASVNVVPLSPPNAFTRLIERRGRVLYEAARSA